MNKNIVIFILVVLIFIGGIWGSVADRKKMALKKQLSETVEQMEKLTKQNAMQREQVLGKTAGLQGTLAEKEEQVAKARKELVSLRKELKALESQLSSCNVTIQQITQEKNELASKMMVAKNEDVKKTADDAKQEPPAAVSSQQAAETDKQVASSEEGQVDQYDVQSLLEQLQTAELTIDQLRQKLDAGNAQMMGLEKLLEEKNSAMEETSLDMDRLKINMDVLLSKIADQRDDLQEVQEENRDLVKELANKNEEVADLQEEIMRQPVQE